jgi:tripartite-type tricarboxylate transporter receptor subunit TctC
MERFLPGSTFVVKNVPGAGHLIGANTIYASKPDGLTIGTFSTGITISQIVGKKGIQFDLTKMSWIGKGATDTRVLLISDKAGFDSFLEVKNSKREIKLGTSGVGTGAYNETLLVGRAFDLPLRAMVGYSGSERAMGMLRGEIDGTIGGYSSILEVGGVAKGKILLAFGTVPDVPNARQFVTNEIQRKIVALIEGQGEIYRLCAGPPDIPADRLAALRKAFLDAYNSPELLAEAKKAERPVAPLGGAQVATMIEDVIDQPPEIVALLHKLTTAEPELAKYTGKVVKVVDEGREVVVRQDGKEIGAKISGSRTSVQIDGKKEKRGKIKAGMTCTINAAAPGEEAAVVDCKS